MIWSSVCTEGRTVGRWWASPSLWSVSSELAAFSQAEVWRKWAGTWVGLHSRHYTSIIMKKKVFRFLLSLTAGDSLFFPITDSGDVSSTIGVEMLELLADL